MWADWDHYGDGFALRCLNGWPIASQGKNLNQKCLGSILKIITPPPPPATSSNENVEWILCMRWLQSLLRTVGSNDEVETGCNLFLDARLTSGKLESSVHVLKIGYVATRGEENSVSKQTTTHALKLTRAHGPEGHMVQRIQ